METNTEAVKKVYYACTVKQTCTLYDKLRTNKILKFNITMDISLQLSTIAINANDKVVFLHGLNNHNEEKLNETYPSCIKLYKNDLPDLHINQITEDILNFFK